MYFEQLGPSFHSKHDKVLVNVHDNTEIIGKYNTA